MTHGGKVLVAAPVHSILIDGLISLGYEVVSVERIVRGDALTIISDCIGLVTSNRLRVDRQLLEAAPLIQWVGRMGSGMEIIDTEFAAKRGVHCFSSPDGNANAVAEHAMGLLLSLTKRIAQSQAEIKQGMWNRERNRGVELEGKVVGIVGYGHTGSAFARKLQAFNTRIMAYDIQEVDYPPYVRKSTLSELQREAQIISFHVPYNEETHHYFNTRFLNEMQHPFYLINTSRGAVVESLAVIEGIEKGRILGAGLDVVEAEPPGDGIAIEDKNIMKLANMQQVIMTPHIAGYSEESIYKMSKSLLDKLLVL